MTGNPSGSRPAAFVLCPARSGSTLLRLILNGHPEIACPPETNWVEIFARVGFTVAAASEPPSVNSDSPASPTATERAASICRDVAETILGGYAVAQGKKLWVDKSLASVLFGDLLTKVYPDGKFICLYRQCPDTVASLQEASQWSYEAFGLLPFAQASPANLVQALTAYWVDRITLLQSFEQAHPDLAFRVRYEDLVAEPKETISRIFKFLGVRSEEAVVTAALALQPQAAAAMPGDIKVRFSKEISSSSVGRGWNVPFDMLPQQLRDQVDNLSRELGYRPLPNLRHYTDEPATPLICSEALQGPHSQEAQQLLEQHVTPTPRLGAEIGDQQPALLKLVVTDLPEPWMVDLNNRRIERSDGKANWLALTDAKTLLDVVSGRSNPGMAMRTSALQVVSASDQATPDQFLDCVDDLMALLRG